VEYFNGILFMTTNRLETMDVALQSRIHMAIEYQSLSVATRRKIWTNTINRIGDEEAREDLTAKLSYLKRLNLNGREIQNVMKVALSLASGGSHSDSCRGSGTVRLNISHIKQVVNETSSFQRYFKDRKELPRAQLLSDIRHEGKSPKIVDDDEDSE
jgi:AAA+ superfamily predicted ATPase